MFRVFRLVCPTARHSIAAKRLVANSIPQPSKINAVKMRPIKSHARNVVQSFDHVTMNDLNEVNIMPQTLHDLVQPGKAICYLTDFNVMAENQYRNVTRYTFDTYQSAGYWVGQLTINYPGVKTFTCRSKNKKECKNLCAMAAIYDLRKNNVIDARLKLTIDTSVTNSFKDNIKGPVTLPPIPMDVKQKMMSFVAKFDEFVANLAEYQIDKARAHYSRISAGFIEGKHAAILEGLEPGDDVHTGLEDGETTTYSSGPVDLFTSRPYRTPDADTKSHCHSMLRDVYAERDRRYRRDMRYADLARAQERLPIRNHKESITDAIRDHRAIVIAGDTGSGKSTQVPQFILEELLRNEGNINNYANIAVTQPRRISAISLAERVAQELAEPGAGYTVGHNVRFDSKQPQRDLNIMTFFTTGMLLRKMQQNPDLKGVTHLIVDEVHERDCTTDFLLILIKRLLMRRRDLRVIFMSASMDASLFARYFDNCPVISVSGRCYPVDDIYLNDICRDMRMQPPRREPTDRAPRLNINMVADLIKHIDDTRNPGAVLCFMPGWKEMKALQKELEFCRSRNKLKILLAHSKLPIHEQRLIFSPAGDNERKIILATNIAETSITINDVRYVIDTGLCNSIDYDPDLNMSAFGTRWISRANAKQRSGRAGRTSTGECFKLYNAEEEARFRDFPHPELLRIPLESVIMEAKCHCPTEKAVTFLAAAIQHPSCSAIHNALEELTLLGVLDEKENLTVLGKRISDFSTHPRLSVSLVTASALGCLYPVLNASAVLSSTQEPFMSSLTDKAGIRKTKERLCIEAIAGNREPIQYMSDHVAYGNLLAQYDNANMSKHELNYFINENDLMRNAMFTIAECRNLYAKMMVSANFSSGHDWYSFDSLSNKNMNELELMMGALTHAFYPKIIRIVRGQVKGGRMYPNKVTPMDVVSNASIRMASESIVKTISMGRQLNSGAGNDSDDDSDYVSMNDEDKRPMFLVYLNSRVDQEANQIVVRDGSVIPPLTILLFGGRHLSYQDTNARQGDQNFDSEYGMMNVTLDHHKLLSFKIHRDDATAIHQWRGVWQKYLDWYIHTKNTKKPVDENDSIIAGTMNEFIELNKKLYAACR